ncbi:MAG TPA: methyltransferase domain-containing protein [Burkholderiales bacterium]
MEAEVGARMLGRLDYVKLAPRRILDAGSGPGREAKALTRRYPKAQLLALDFALPVLRGARRRFFEKKLLICGDIVQLPLADGSIDLLWSNMALHWAADPAAALREFERVLAPQGLLMFSTLGPDTLKELRAAAGAARVHAFVDMHDVGDMLVAAGLAAPVIDMEMLEITYPDGGTLLQDLRRSGQTSARADRARGLAGRRFDARLRAQLLPRATFEVVYGHAWKREQAKTIRVFKRIP